MDASCKVSSVSFPAFKWHWLFESAITKQAVETDELLINV